MKTNKTGSSNSSSRSMFSPSFIEFGQPRFPRSGTLSQSGPLKPLEEPTQQKYPLYLFRAYSNNYYSLKDTDRDNYDSDHFTLPTPNGMQNR